MIPSLDTRRFLRDEELDYGLALVLGAERRLVKALDKFSTATGLTQRDLRLLMVIHATPGLTVRSLRRKMGATVPTMARQLGQLDKEGWIDRRAEAEDGRERLVSLSETGADRLKPVIDEMRAIVRDAYRSAGVEAVAGARDVLALIAKG